jgi:hypothetical protein
VSGGRKAGWARDGTAAVYTIYFTHPSAPSDAFLCKRAPVSRLKMDRPWVVPTETQEES